MKNILIIILSLFWINTVNAQLLSTISSDIPKLNVKQDVQVLSELSWDINSFNSSNIQIKLLGKQLQFQNISERTDNFGYRYILAATPDNTANIELVIKDKKLVFGNLTDNTTDYIILEEGKRYFLAERIDNYQPSQECDTPDTGGKALPKYNINYKDESKSSTVLPDDNCNVRILLLYTDDVANNFTDPAPTIQASVARMNAAFNNSFVNHDIEVALIEEINVNEFDGGGNPYPAETLLDWLVNPSDGVIDYIHDLRALYDADMVQLITSQLSAADGRGLCGRAWDILPSASGSFALTAFYCLNNSYEYTLSHEFGHLYGCRHDVFVDGGSTPFPFGHGYVNVPEDWRTIMAYRNACEPNFCPTIGYFSNPNVGHPVSGSPTGISGQSDNESVIDATYSTIVNFEDTPNSKVVWNADTVIDGEIANIRGETSITTDVNEPYNVNNGGVATFIAGDNITLRPGFRAAPGASFRAVIASCTQGQ